MQKVFLDVDGVLADFVGNILKECGKDSSQLKRGEYDLNESLGLDMHSILKNLDWYNIPLTEDYQIFLDFVKKHFKKHQIYICTKVFDYESAKGKMKWIRKNIPGYPFLLTDNKCRLAGKGLLLIDDCDEEVNKFRGMGGKAILVPRIWNTMFANKIPMKTYLEESLLSICGKRREEFF